jgi:hypothetical protein
LVPSPVVALLSPRDGEADIARLAAGKVQHLGAEKKPERFQLFLPEAVDIRGFPTQRGTPSGLCGIDGTSAVGANVGRKAQHKVAVFATLRGVAHRGYHGLQLRPVETFANCFADLVVVSDDRSSFRIASHRSLLNFKILFELSQPFGRFHNLFLLFFVGVNRVAGEQATIVKGPTRAAAPSPIVTLPERTRPNERKNRYLTPGPLPNPSYYAGSVRLEFTGSVPEFVRATFRAARLLPKEVGAFSKMLVMSAIPELVGPAFRAPVPLPQKVGVFADDLV